MGNPIGAGIGAATGIIGGIMGGINEGNQVQWNQGMLVNLLNQLNQYSKMGMDISSPYYDQAANWALGGTGAYKDYLFGPGGLVPNMSDQASQTFQDQRNQAWNPDRGMYTDPYVQAAQGQFGQMGQMAQNIDPQALALLNNQGKWFDQSNQLQGIATQMGSGGTPAQQTMESNANQAMANQGATNSTNFLRDRMYDAFGQGGYSGRLGQAADISAALAANGGQTAATQQLMGAGQNILGNAMDTTYGAAGQTRTGAQAQAIGLDTLMNQGRNQTSDWLTQRGANLAAQNPLLSMNEAMSFTQDAAARENQNSAQAAQRQALARGGGPGVISGQSQGGMAEYQDKMLQNLASARQSALMSQQGLNLNQLQQGLGAVNSGGALAANREQNAQNLFLTPEQIAAQRYGTGLSAGANLMGQGAQQQSSQMMGALNQSGQYQNIANDYMTAMGNMGINAGNADTSRMTAGGNLSNQYLNSMLAGQLGAQNLWGFDLGAMGQGSNMLGQSQGMQSNAIMNPYAMYNQNQQLNLNRNAADMSGQNTAMNWMNNAMNMGWNYNSAGANTLNNIANQYLQQLTGNGIQGMAGLRPMSPTNPWDSLTNAGSSIVNAYKPTGGK